MRRRIHVCLTIALLLTFLINSMAFAVPVSSQTSASINKAIAYLHTVQNKDGGFPERAGAPSNQTTTCWVMVALAAAGEDVTNRSLAPSGLDPIDFLKNSDILLESTNDYARLLLALSAAGQSSTFKSIDLVDRIKSFQQQDGQFAQPQLKENGFINSHLWSILALASAGQDIPNKEQAKEWLIKQQNQDGGFGWAQGVASDSDDTGIAIQALVLMGEDPQTSSVIQDALSYLKRCQGDDGGFNSGNDWMSNGSNASSTAWALQAVIAAGINPSSGEWEKEGNTPDSYLISLQDKKGYYNWKTDVVATPTTTTAHTITALAQKPYPVNIDYNSRISSADKSGLSDLHPDYWAYQSISSLIAEGVLGGYPDGTFRPDNPVSRAEFTRYLVCGLGLENIKAGAVDFPDVLNNHWAYPYISITVARGFVTGMPDGTFNSNGEINGAQLATMLVKVSSSMTVGKKR
jgi:prenyltransferase beta subunit